MIYFSIIVIYFGLISLVSTGPITCTLSCQPGINCKKPICSCPSGYLKHPIFPRLCNPICSQPCINGSCVKPETCGCKRNFILNKSNTYECISKCATFCLNGTCSPHNVCVCNDGFELNKSDKFKCIPKCFNECINGFCSAPNVCSCNEGFLLDDQFQCLPECGEVCKNGKCKFHGKCACRKGYVLDEVYPYKCVSEFKPEVIINQENDIIQQDVDEKVQDLQNLEKDKSILTEKRNVQSFLTSTIQNEILEYEMNESTKNYEIIPKEEQVSEKVIEYVHDVIQQDVNVSTNENRENHEIIVEEVQVLKNLEEDSVSTEKPNEQSLVLTSTIQNENFEYDMDESTKNYEIIPKEEENVNEYVNAVIQQDVDVSTNENREIHEIIVEEVQVLKNLEEDSVSTEKPNERSLVSTSTIQNEIFEYDMDEESTNNHEIIPKEEENVNEYVNAVIQQDVDVSTNENRENHEIIVEEVQVLKTLEEDSVSTEKPNEHSLVLTSTIQNEILEYEIDESIKNLEIIPKEEQVSENVNEYVNDVIQQDVDVSTNGNRENQEIQNIENIGDVSTEKPNEQFLTSTIQNEILEYEIDESTKNHEIIPKEQVSNDTTFTLPQDPLTCNKGYILDSTNNCIPYCKISCINSYCSAPNLCTCRENYVPDPNLQHKCVQKCEMECTDINNAICIDGKMCVCLEGYVLDETTNPFRCNKPEKLPSCMRKCANGVCVGANVCQCKPGYEKDPKDDSSCLPSSCEVDCINGRCVTPPGVCQCDDNFEFNALTKTCELKVKSRSSLKSTGKRMIYNVYLIIITILDVLGFYV